MPDEGKSVWLSPSQVKALGYMAVGAYLWQVGRWTYEAWQLRRALREAPRYTLPPLRAPRVELPNLEPDPPPYRPPRPRRRDPERIRRKPEPPQKPRETESDVDDRFSMLEIE